MFFCKSKDLYISGTYIVYKTNINLSKTNMHNLTISVYKTQLSTRNLDQDYINDKLYLQSYSLSTTLSMISWTLNPFFEFVNVFSSLVLKLFLKLVV